MAVSGKFYLSLQTYNSSANRDAHKQNCRHAYKVTNDEGIELTVDNETIIHVTKKAENDIDSTDITVVNKFDVRPYPPAKSHDMVFEAFDDLKP